MKLPADKNQTLSPGVQAIVAIVVLLVSLGVAFWVGQDLFAIVFLGEICRGRYGCETWASHPWSMAFNGAGVAFLMVIFIGLAWGAIRMLIKLPEGGPPDA